MKQQILSIALALCLFISPQSMAQAGQEAFFVQEDVLTEEPASEQAARDSTVPTPTEVYESMIALKEQDGYKEGTEWTNSTPYPDAAGNSYHWKGGPLGGANVSAVGCVAFAFILSDAAFDSLPARMYAAGEFSYEDIKVGDILRVSNDAHTVIVLEVSDAGVVVAEGNISTGDHQGKVHWGRAISKEEVMSNTSHYITRYPEGYVSPDDPTANDIIAQGSLDGGLTWKLTKAGTLTISGNGAMPDFGSTGEQPWGANSSQIRKVVIENGVTSIGSCAFWNCGVLSAEIASSVTTIGNSAFRGSSIISVTIPSGVKTIGDSAFRECQNLSSVTVSEGVETIDQNAFRSCASLTSIALPASIGEVGAGAFFQCQAMTSATFAAGSKQVKLGDNLFTECYYLMSVTLPRSIDRIGADMFQNCLMLAEIEIPQGAQSIGDRAFASCSRLSAIIIPDSVTTIGTAAFSRSALTDIYFTGTEAQWNSISKIGDTATEVLKMTIHYEYTPDSPPEETTPSEPTTPPEETTPSEPATPPEETTPSEPATPPEETMPSNPATPPEETTPSNPATPPEQTQPSNPTTPPQQTQPSNPAAAPEQTTVSNPATTSRQTTASRPITAITRGESAQIVTQVPASRPNTTVPFIASGSSKEGWDAIKEETAKASAGKQIDVNMNGATVVPGDVLDSVKGQNVTISFDMGNGIIWLVNGEDVTADHVNDVDFSVEVGTSAIPQNIVNTVAEDRQATQLSLAHSGDFGYSAVLRINVGSVNAKLYANLFYYNESDGGLEFVTAAQINEDGIAELTFTHASDYVIVVDDNAMEEVSNGASLENNDGLASVDGSSEQETETVSPDTDEFIVVSGADAAGLQNEGNGLMWLLLIGAVGVVAAGIIIYRIRKKGKK